MVKKVMRSQAMPLRHVVERQAIEIQSLQEMLHNRDSGAKEAHVSPLLIGAGCGAPASATEVRSLSPPKGGAYEGTIPGRMSELSHSQDYCHNRIDELVKKLEAILGPPSPATAGDKPPSSVLCPLVEALESRIRIQQQINSRINDMIERIAL